MILSLFALALVAQSPGVQLAASQPSSQLAKPQGKASLRVRIVRAAKTPEGKLDPKLNDLFGSLRNLAYDTFDLKEDKALTLDLEQESKIVLPGNRTLIVSPREIGTERGKRRVRVKLDIPEIKFSSRVWIKEGSTLLVGGGPKLDDGVLLFAVGVSDIRQ